MKHRKAIRIVCDILVAALLFCFMMSLVYFVNGSLEMMPAEEQQDKASVAAMLLMVMFGIACAACIAIRIKFRK